MNAKQAKRLRRRARELTPHLPESDYQGAHLSDRTRRLGECRRGAYKALKSGSFKVID